MTPIQITPRSVEIFDYIRDYIHEMAVVTFGKGAYLTRSDDDLEEIFYVLSGRIKVECVTESGRGILVDEVGPQEFVGKISYIYEQHLFCDIVAVTDAALIKIQKSTFKKLENDPKFLKLFFFKTSKRIYFIYKKLLLKNLFPLEERLAHHILAHADGGRFSFKSMYSLCNELSVSRKNLYNVMNRLVEKQVVEKAGATLVILDPPALSRLAKGVCEVLDTQPCDFRLDVVD